MLHLWVTAPISLLSEALVLPIHLDAASKKPTWPLQGRLTYQQADSCPCCPGYRLSPGGSAAFHPGPSCCTLSLEGTGDGHCVPGVPPYNFI